MINEEQINEIVKALAENKDYNYSKNGLCISAKASDTGCSISIEYKNTEAIDFKKFIQDIDDEVFVDVCDILGDTKITNLHNALESNNITTEIKEFKDTLIKYLSDKIKFYSKQLEYARANV